MESQYYHLVHQVVEEWLMGLMLSSLTHTVVQLPVVEVMAHTHSIAAAEPVLVFGHTFE